MSNVVTLGIAGLGTIGWDLALNLADQGFTVHGWEHEDGLDRRRNADQGIEVHEDLDLVDMLPRPRVIMLMVTAGKPSTM